MPLTRATGIHYNDESKSVRERGMSASDEGGLPRRRFRSGNLSLRPGLASSLGAFSRLAPELAEAFVSVASDIAVVVDAGGVVRSVATASGEEAGPAATDWVGRPWVDTVTGETRRKIELLLQDVASTGIARRREVNHPSPAGLDIPFAYSAIRLGDDGPVLAVGRDLRAITAIHERFAEAQQEIEREYWKQRQTEARYRVLFQVATDGVLVVDAATLKILDANQAATQLFDLALDQLVGREATVGIDRASRPAVTELLTASRATGLPAEIGARLSGRRIRVHVAATPFRSADSMALLVRARAIEGGGLSVLAVEQGGAADDGAARLVSFVQRTPDGVVVTDSAGHVQLANPSFLRLVQVDDERQVQGRPLADFVGRDAPELAALLAAAREQGMAARQRSVVRGSRGAQTAIELAAALLPEGDQESVGFTLRPIDVATGVHEARPQTVVAGDDVGDMLAGVGRLTAQLGKLPLADLLREITDHLERHFVRAALARSSGNRDAAAGLLGVSPDAFDADLHRLGIGDTPPGHGGGSQPG